MTKKLFFSKNIYLRGIILFTFATFFFVPFPGSNSIPIADAQCGPNGCCGSLTSGAQCKMPVSGNIYDCPGGIVDGYCPAPNEYKCCIPANTTCSNSSSGKCQTVGGSQACSTSYVSNQCPGPAAIKCCVNQLPPPPSNVTGSCSPSGTVATVNWNQVSGYPYYYARIHDETTNSEGSYSGVITGSSFSFSNAIPGHEYSYWVHTTYSSGSPYSTEVPTYRSTKFTCPTPACGDPTAPTGSVLSTGVNTTASSVYNNDQTNYGPKNLVDGVVDTSRFWNAGPAAKPQWVELNLGAPQEVTGMKLYVRQAPDGATTHQILTGSTTAPTNVARTLNCYTKDNQVINVVFNPPLTNTQYIRVNTTASPAWVAWNEITVYGAAPGAQASSPGIIFSGDGQYNFGQGQASERNWVVGGSVYPEVFPTASLPSTTSYQYLLDKATNARIPVTNVTTLAGCSDLNNCTLPANLPNGVYQATGNLRLNTYAFPPNKNYVFLIDGDLTVLGSLIVPNGSTAFFSASQDIIVDRNVGTATNLFPLPSGQLQGFFSADRDFTIDGINDCVAGRDKMLNVEGSIITNAFGNGGKFRTKRDLCGDNPNMPSLTIRLRLDFLLNTPILLMKQKTTFREDAP